MTARRTIVLGAVALSAAVGLGPATAVGSGGAHRDGAVVVGSTVGSLVPCGDITAVMTATAPGAPTYSSPVAGVVTSWTTGAGPGAGHLLRLLVVRPSTTTPGAYAILGKTPMQILTPSTFNTFATRIPIAAGQQLGLDVGDDTGTTCGLVGAAGDNIQYVQDLNTDSVTEFAPDTAGPGARLNLSAVVEPDADHDGFGDVSQDLCPQSASSQGVCPAPDTRVSKKPKKVSTRRSATIVFSSPTPGASFTCTVDKKAAVPCTSPFRKKYKIGKHKVVITAVLGSTADPIPVTVKFKVVRP